jgi:hypothetical protein
LHKNFVALAERWMIVQLVSLKKIRSFLLSYNLYLKVEH